MRRISKSTTRPKNKQLNKLNKNIMPQTPINPQTYRSRVVTVEDLRQDPTQGESSYLSKVTRYVPGEIIALYIGITGLVPNGFPELLKWLSIAIVLITPLWTLYATHIPGKPLPIFQAIIATISFSLWAIATRGELLLGANSPLYASLFGMLFAFITPMTEWLFFGLRKPAPSPPTPPAT